MDTIKRDGYEFEVENHGYESDPNGYHWFTVGNVFLTDPGLLQAAYGETEFHKFLDDREQWVLDNEDPQQVREELA